MHFTEDKERYTILKDLPIDKGPNHPALRERHVLYLKTPKKCTNCKNTQFQYKDKKARAPFLDCIDGILVDIVVYKKRFVCKFCGKLNSAPDSADFNKSIRAKHAAVRVITDRTLTMEGLASQGGFSHPLGSGALQALIDELNLDDKENRAQGSAEDLYTNRVTELREMVKSFLIKENLAFVPFLYEKKWRCLVCTWNPMTEDAYLLDILESTDLSLTDRISSRIDDKDWIETVFCDADEKTIAYMTNQYPSNTEVAIARLCMRDSLKRHYTEKQQEFSFSRKPYNQLLKILQTANSKTWAWSWHEWLDQLDPDQSANQEAVGSFIIRNHAIIDASFHYDYQAPFIDLLNMIATFRNNSFELMRLRMLFANHAHFDQDLSQQFIHAINDVYVPLPAMSINNFGVRISDLIAELKAEREMFFKD